MKENYEKIPENLLTGKDLDYLTDMFNWNYSSLKMIYNCIDNMKDKDIINFFNEIKIFFNDNLNNILDILNEGDINYE